MNGSTAKLLRKYSKMSQIDPEEPGVGYTELKKIWQRNLDAPTRTRVREEMKEELRSFNEKDDFEQTFFVPD